MKNIFYIILFLSAIFISEGDSFAQNSDKIVLVPDICSDPEGTPNALRTIQANRMGGNIVRCVEKIVSEKGDQLIEGMVEDYSFVVFHVIILAIIIFFMRVMFGVARARGVISMFMAKVLLVLFVVNPDNTNVIIDWRDALIEFPQEISMNVLRAVESPINNSGSSTEAVDVFDRLDQYVLQMFGVDESTLSPDKDVQTEVYIGVAAMVAGLFFTGSIGAAISAISVGFVIAVMTAVAQAVLFFCTVIIALNFLAAIAPIAVTCILFQPTKRITSMWFQYMLIYIIQPILLMTVLGMTMGIIDGVVDNFDDPHSKILGKLENVDGKPQHEVTIFDCSNMSIPGEAMSGLFKQAGLMDQVVAQAAFAGEDFDKYSMGYGTIGSDTNFSADALNLNFGSNCQIKVPALQIDFDNNAFIDQDQTQKLPEEELRELMGVKMGITVLLIMLISFLVKMPQMVNMMVGQGVIAELSKYASTPVQKGQEALYGSADGKTPGVFANALGSLDKQYKTRSASYNTNTVKRTQ